MERFIIKGETKLRGEVMVSGSKNAALPIIAATILIKGECVIHNVPNIRDIRTFLKILEKLGSEIKFSKNTIRIDNSNIKSFTPDYKLVRNIRASVLLLGPLLARFKEVKIPHPGGCFIGARPINVHLKGFEFLNTKVDQDGNFYHLKSQKLIGSENIVAEMSVTATENLVMAACFSKGKTKIRLAANEPHVEDLLNFLVKTGAKIKKMWGHKVEIEGVGHLNPVEYTIIPDQIEAGTFATAAAASRGNVYIHNFIAEHNDALLNVFDDIKVIYDLNQKENILHVKPATNYKARAIKTEVYPGFVTDLQAPIAVLMTQAEGTSEIYETIFEGRLNYINELNKMGANGIIRNSHQATITGPTPLYGTHIISLDLRAGATLIIASLIAEGESKIDKIEVVDRGYEKIEDKLNVLGANIRRVKI